MAATILTSVYANGGRASRYGDFIIVIMHACSFVTTPMEFHQNTNWARARASTGNPVRDRTLFVDRFDTVIGREGSGVSNKGSPLALLRIVKSMRAAAVFMEGWNVPRDVGGVEIRKKAVKAPVEPKIETPAEPPVKPTT